MKKLLLFVLFVCNLSLAEPLKPADSFKSDVDAIKERNFLVVAMTKKDSIPFFSGDESNTHGLDVDIAKSIGLIMNIPVRFRRDAESFAEVVEQVKDGRADLAVSKLSITGPRLLTVSFSAPYVKLKQAMIVNRLWISQNSGGQEVYPVIRNFNGRLSFIKDTSYDTFARVNFPNAEFIPKTNWDEIVDDVIEGRSAGGYRDELEIKKTILQKPRAALSTKTITISDRVDNIAVAVNKNSPRLLAIINHVIANEYNNISTKKLIERYKQENNLQKP